MPQQSHAPGEPGAGLGAFLRSRRARIRPQDVGVPDYGRRRVPGLRREELAQLAGVSAPYYIRFEQGRAENVSAEIVDAIAKVLRLDTDELAHLRALVRATAHRPARTAAVSGPQRVRPGLLRLLETMRDTPAFVVGRRTDILAWNPLAAALLTDFGQLPAERRNKAWLVFCHDEVRSRFVNWPVKARDIVAYLRMDLGRHPGDPSFAALVAELTARSPEFGPLWDAQEVRDKTHGGYHLRHPSAGEFTLSYESLKLPDDPDQTLITYTAEADTPSQAALGILADQVRSEPAAVVPAG
ncbi:helix-turn-helix transcriptional regulator [Streptomyces sp. TRM66268-LWL]|uniref:Helix-turn-helix transcriptional regulator n=1 Tax=Streptomyces polyasparticus TaxID=2767826 RepID=A0ABR7SND9_9ACTN|nr:helix-turn-helix transcriptional regulator [Streptomyces polyasparticus]MBC9716429.1 helix-turn-helix transcriptional regulator [Streptomyces polyasparticus]